MTDALIAVIILGLANGALTQVVTYGGIFEPVRTAAQRQWDLLGDMLDCALCFGLWSAAALSALAVWRLADVDTLDSVLLWGAGSFAIHMFGLLSGTLWRALTATYD